MLSIPFKLPGFCNAVNKRTKNARTAPVLAFVIILSGIGPVGAFAQCGARIDAGWRAYRAEHMTQARAAFTAALKRCPKDAGALTGLSYVALRQQRITEAIQLADAVLRRDPGNEDALIARGIAAMRTKDTERARQIFTHVLERNPARTEARDYLAQMPAAATPTMAPTNIPDTVIAPVRTAHRYFEVQTADGWSRFYVKGVNLGAALPGKHPSEFPDSATYASWIAQMHEMGANVIRVYTIHPPQFYQALLEFNLKHRDSPLRVVHGVWAELPHANDFSGAAFEKQFQDEMRRVVDVLHSTGVSPWVLAYVIGREWEPAAVLAYNRLHATSTSYNGKFLRVSRGNPMEVWLARMCDVMIAYESDRYHEQRPIAFTNWPTLDPLKHPTESTVSQELAIRRRNGERIDERPREYDNDIVALDPRHTAATSAFKAGWFASYHAYPYYPDFMVYERSYEGYLRSLLAASDSLPLLVAEYGVPNSIGIAHLEMSGRHHGGHSEADAARINAELTREIAAAGAAGGIFFAWIDEWFKKNWVTIEFELPADRNRVWYNRLDAEQHYGIIAMDGARPLQWKPVASVGSAQLFAASDEAYLRLRITGDGRDNAMVGFDVVDPKRGDFRLPDGAGSPSQVGFEFALIVRGETVRVVADSASNPFRFPAINGRTPGRTLPFTLTAGVPPGYFTGRMHMRMNRPFRSVANADGRYTPLLVVTNRQRYTPDGTELIAAGYDRGILPAGAEPDGLWQRNDSLLEVRIPWTLLNFTDPSSRRVLQDGLNATSEFGTVVVDKIRMVFAVRHDAQWRQSDAVAYALESWEAPQYRARRRPAFDALRTVFETLKIVQ